MFPARMKRLADEERYPEAVEVRVMPDELDTHRHASPYEAFPPAEARRISRWPGLHHTPRRASRLDQARIEWRASSGAVPRPVHTRRGDAGGGGGDVGDRAQRDGGDGGVALHERRRPRQAPALLPNATMMVRYYDRVALGSLYSVPFLHCVTKRAAVMLLT